MDIIILALLSVAVFNYKFEKESYLKNFMKGIALGLIGYFFSVFRRYFKEGYLIFNETSFFFSILIGSFFGLIFMIVYYFKKE